eukprot:SAG11_NODE_14025_length_628_cov_1.001890_1_plen_28_part_10
MIIWARGKTIGGIASRVSIVDSILRNKD